MILILNLMYDQLTLENLIEPRLQFNNEDSLININTITNKRKFNDNIEQSRKKQKPNNYKIQNDQDSITTKTTYKHDNISNQFGPKDNIQGEDNYFRSVNEMFQKVLEKDNTNTLNKLKKKPEKKKKKDKDIEKLQINLLSLLDFIPDDKISTSDKSDDESSIKITQSNSLSQSKSKSEESDDDSQDSYDMDNDHFNIESKDNECFFCSWGNSAHDSIYSKDLQQLNNIYVKYRAFCQDIDLAKMLHLYYKIDKDHFGALKETQKILDTLYSKDIKKLNFNDPNIKIDTHGSLFKIEALGENDEKIYRSRKNTRVNIKNKRAVLI